MNKSWTVVACALIASGCASLPPAPESVRFTNLHPEGPRARIVDERPSDERVTRSGTQGKMHYHYLGDAAVQPALLELLAATAARATPGELRDQPVVIHRVEVGYWKAPSSSGGGSSAPFMYMPGAPVGAVILGNLIGQGLVSLLGDASSKASMPASSGGPYASAVFEISVGDRKVSSYDNVAVDSAASPDAALERAVASGLATIAQQLAAPPVVGAPIVN